MVANERDTLQAQLSALIPVLRGLVRDRIAARDAGDFAEADRLAVQIQQVATTYNGYVARLLQIEAPGTVILFLDRVGDVIITGVKAGAATALEATEAVGATLARAALPLFVPLALTALAALWIVGKTGLVRVRR